MKKPPLLCETKRGSALRFYASSEAVLRAKFGAKARIIVSGDEAEFAVDAEILSGLDVAANFAGQLKLRIFTLR